ncbi:MAG TPA: hypothetical protein VJ863_11665, partial [Sphaerochaeta sp.]|nr:hypothetical protein [Sphaerochaeta sp.]
MKRRRTTLILCTLLCILLPLFLMGCQTYTAAKGKAAIEPIASIPEEKTITKISVLQEQAKASLVEQQQAEREMKLTAKEKEIEGSLAALNSRLEKATEENQQLIETLTELSAEKEESTRIAQQSLQEGEQAQAHSALLASEILDLQSLLSEKESAYLVALQGLRDERDGLALEIRILKAQIEEKTLSIEEKQYLEQLRGNETKRLVQEEQDQLLASQKELNRLALEKEWRQIPSLELITYPRLYTTDTPTSLAKDGEKLRTLMLPLDDVPWKDDTTVTEVHKSIRDLEVPIIFVTGHMENVVALVRQMRRNAALFSTGAIITSFPIQELSTYGVEIQYQEKKSLRLMMANLPEYQVVQEFSQGKNWQATQKKLTENRLALLREIVGEGSLTVPTLLGASLYEPSYRDWNTFSPVAYRQTDYLWPLSAFLENEGFYDAYRLTHFSEATNAGNTLISSTWRERIDFLYSRKIL